jgi:uncharacterized cupin superfamily protein
MRILPNSVVPHVKKPEGTNVSYYLFKDYEIHYNEQAPHTTQAWHHHDKIWETLYIIEGELTAMWRQDGEHHSEVVRAGDLVETERSPHTFVNSTNNSVRFLVVKHIPSDEDFSEVFKQDKIPDTPPED